MPAVRQLRLVVTVDDFDAALAFYRDALGLETEAEAVAIANDTPYGLGASLYTDDLHVAHRVSRALKAGTVGVNCYSEGDMTTPFGGYKQSGFGGHDKSLRAHDQYTETKTIWIQLRTAAD